MKGTQLLVFVLGVLMGYCSSGCHKKISQSQGDRVKQGMTLAEVEAILGKGEKLQGGEFSGEEGHERYVWGNDIWVKAHRKCARGETLTPAEAEKTNREGQGVSASFYQGKLEEHHYWGLTQDSD